MKPSIPSFKYIHNLFSWHARKTPESTAVASLGHEVSYASLDGLSDQVANSLASRKIGPKNIVGVYMPAGIPMVSAILGILKTGAAYMPIDTDQPVPRTVSIVANSAPDIVLTFGSYIDDLTEITATCMNLDKDVPFVETRRPLTGIPKGDTAYVIHTSGSTGVPKGIPITHAALLNLIDAIDRAAPLGRTDRCSVWTNLGFDVSVYEIWSALLTGACLCIPPKRLRFDTDKYLNWLASEKISSAYIPPFMLQDLARRQRTSPFPMKRILTGVEPIPEPLLCDIKRHTPNLTLINGYGPAEAAICATLYLVGETPSRNGNAPIGKPIRNLDIFILDKSGQPVNDDSKGEIAIQGVQVAKGYLNNPGQTVESFISSPFSPTPESILYKTGDIGFRRKDGNIVFTGRKDFQIKISGVRIEPGEIESVITKFPGISQASALLKPSPEGRKRLIAYIDTSPDARELMKFLKDQLPNQMLPAAVISLERLPQTPQGKIDRHALMERDDTELVRSEKTAASNGILPKTNLEKTVIAIWETVMGLSPISMEDNFFLLGGDSISGTKIISAINRALSVDIDLGILFQHPILEEFTQIIDSMPPKKRAAPLRDKSSPVPLREDQQLIWLFENLHPGTTVYHIPLVFQIYGQIDFNAFKKALAEICRRHEALNAVFRLQNDTPIQLRNELPPVVRRQKMADLVRDRGDDTQPIEREWIRNSVGKPFNLETGPLFRTDVLIRGASSTVICFTAHHIIFDGWSAGLFIQELNYLYSRITSGKPIREKGTGISFFDHVRSETDTIQEQWKSAKHFFQNYLRNLPEKPAPKPGSFDSGTHPVKIKQAVRQQIREYARYWQTTEFAILLACFQIVLTGQTGVSDQLTGIAYAGRTRPGADTLIGFLMNTLVVRSLVRMDLPFDKFVKHVTVTLHAVYRYRHIPLHRLARHFRPRETGHGLVGSMFLMQTMDFPGLRLGEAEAEYIRPDEALETANTDITLELFPVESSFHGRIKYRTNRYTPTDIAQLADQFHDLIGSAMNTPRKTIDQLIWKRKREFPVSPMQHTMIMETLRAPQGAGCYVEQVICSMDRAIDVPRFSNAWEKVLVHHDNLRLGFKWQGLEKPEQYIADIPPVKIEYSDWSHVPAPEKTAYIEMFLKADRRLGFRLDKPPAFRLSLFKMEEQKFIFVWSLHHCIADGRTMATILKNLFHLYKKPETALKPAAPFFQFIYWLNRQDNHKAKAFWQKQLSGFTESFSFPIPGQDSPIDPGRRQSHAISLTTGNRKKWISAITARKIKQLCQSLDVKLNAFLMAAWAILLSHYSGRNDVLFGVTVSIRKSDGRSDLQTGIHINTIPLRVKIAPEKSLVDFVAHLGAKWREIREFDHASLADIHKWSDVKGTTVLSEIYFSYDYNSIDTALDPAKEWISCTSVSLLERTPAALFMTVHGTDELSATVEYDQRKFQPDFIEQLLTHYAFLLKSAAENPNAPLMALSILSESENASIARDLNTLQKQILSSGCIHHLLEIQASINRGATAIEVEDRILTYAELESNANRIANLLRQNSPAPGGKVAVIMDQDADLICAILGILKTGAAYVPLDPTYPEDRLNFILSDVKPDLVISHSDIQLHQIPDRHKTLYLDQAGQDNGQPPDGLPGAEVTPGNEAYIIYTSGSTGKPKGVIVPHSALASFTKSASAVYDIQPSDRVLQFASISFDASAEEIYPTLFSGATLIMKPRSKVYTPGELLDFCELKRVTVLDLPTAYWHVMVDLIDTLNMPERLRLVIIGGEEADPDKVARWNNALKGRIRLMNTYGPTETTVAVTYADLTQGVLPGKIPIGKPFPNVSLAILNQFRQPVPLWVPGELYIGGPQTALGYVGRPGLTAKTFTKIPFLKTDTVFYKSGDYVYLSPNGNVIFNGRRDRQIQVRGFRVEPGEIERCVNAYQGIAQSAVVPAKTPETGTIINLFVAPESSLKTPLDVKPLKAWIRSRLPHYMVPDSIRVLETIPLTPSGKVDYKVLEKNKDSGHERVSEKQETRHPVSEQDDYKSGLKEIWNVVLGKEADLDDNFFDIGGSSLSAIRLVSAIEKKFAISIPILTVFNYPTIREMAQVLKSRDKSRFFTYVKAQNKTGDQMPIFFLAGKKNLDSVTYSRIDFMDHPFYTATVFAHHTIDGRVIPMDVWEIAHTLIREIRMAVPSGPVIIAGFCRNSIIAHEIAIQMTRMGKEVALLVLIDEFWQKRQMTSFMGHHIKGMFRQGPSRILKKIIPKTREKFQIYRHALDKKQETRCLADGKPVPGAVQFRLMENAFWKAYASYVPMPYENDVLLLDSSKWAEKFNPQLRRFYKGRCIKNEINGTHKDWFTPSLLTKLIRQIHNY